MSQSSSDFSFEHLSVAERMILVERIWNSIAAERPMFPLSKARQAELERRLAEHEQDPSTVRTWEEIKSAVRKRERK